MKISLFTLGSNLKHETLFGILVYTFVFSPHNLCVLNANLSDNALYLETFTVKLGKHKIATKMLRKPHIFYSLSHINAQFMFSACFLIGIFFLFLWKEITFTSKTSKTSAVFYVFTVAISIIPNILTII